MNSQMIRELLSHYHLPWLSCVGLLLFVAVFAGVLAWTFRKGSSGIYAVVEKLPLKDLESTVFSKEGHS